MPKIEVVYVPANAKTPWQIKIPYIEGMTVGDALLASTLFQDHPELVNAPVGIFSRIVSLTTRVQASDRIEVYRPLARDPKDIRRQRAKRLC
jgi:hypothetical protein